MQKFQHASRALRFRILILSFAALAGTFTQSPAWSRSWNSKLTISGSPSTSVVATHAFTFTPTVSGSGGRTVSFSIEQKPTWASFNQSTGTLSGTPSAAQAGSYSNIVIVARDRVASASLGPFSIQVTGGTAAPKISGTPVTSVTAGHAYSFQPTATGPSGATLSFSVQNKPAWATFSIATGALTGTPQAANVGTDPNIVISASDSGGSASLPAFSIAVNAAVASNPTGTATLAWVAPTTNTNGAPLTNLAGFYIYDGPSASSLSLVTTIANPTTTTYTVGSLPTGTWYFAVVAYNSAGAESSESNVVSKTF